MMRLPNNPAKNRLMLSLKLVGYFCPADLNTVLTSPLIDICSSRGAHRDFNLPGLLPWSRQHNLQVFWQLQGNHKWCRHLWCRHSKEALGDVGGDRDGKDAGHGGVIWHRMGARIGVWVHIWIILTLRLPCTYPLLWFMTQYLDGMQEEKMRAVREGRSGFQVLLPPDLIRWASCCLAFQKQWLMNKWEFKKVGALRGGPVA